MRSQIHHSFRNTATILAVAASLLASPAAEASRKIYFSSPATRDCYISIYNPGTTAMRLDWGVTGETEPNSWVQSYAKTFGIRGAPLGKNAGSNLPAGGTVLLAYTRSSDRVSTFSGWLFIGENTGAAVASGVCLGAKGVTIPFQIAGGQPF